MKVDTDPFPGTVGVVHDREMLVTGDLSRLRAALTVTDLGAKNDVARLRKSIAATRVRIKRMEDAGAGGQALNRARWSLKGSEAALATAEAAVVREYFEETVEGLSVSPGFWHLVESVSGRAPRIPFVELPEMDGKRPRQYQVEAVQALLEHDHATMELPTGCHAPGTEIIMFDGSLRKIEEVRVGDLLMGPDSQPRTVMRLVSGSAQMYKITPTSTGESFTVTHDHILHLESTPTTSKDRRYGKIYRYPPKISQITVSDYLQKHVTFKHMYKLKRTGVEFVKQTLPVPPYIVGLLVGDGHCRIHNKASHVNVTTMDSEIAEAFTQYVVDIGGRTSVFKKPNDRATRIVANVVATQILKSLGWHNTNNDKDIPRLYLVSSRNDRLELLAGMLDTDGHLGDGCFDIVQKRKHIAEDICYLARSLGFAATLVECYKRATNSATHEPTLYYRVTISGNVCEIPCRLPRKKAAPRMQKKDVLRTGFAIEDAGVGSYYGVQISGDNLYLLRDFTITHNCGKSMTCAMLAYAAWKAGLRTLVIVPNTTLMYQNTETIKKYVDDVSMVGDGRKMKLGTSTVVSTIQSSEKHADLFDVVIIDECHHTSSSSYIKLKMLATKARYWYGLTATPYRADGLDRGLELVCGPVVYRKETRWAIESGFLCPVRVVFVRVRGLPYVKPDVPLAKAYYALAASPKIQQTVEKFVQVALSQGKTAGLVLYRTVEPGREYTEAYDHAFAHGEYKKEFLEFKKGEHPVLVSNAALMGEGVDVPNIDFVVSVVNASSESLIRQILGRGLRPSSNKRKLMFFDVSFGGNPVFEAAGERRLSIYRSVTDDVTVLDV